MIYKKLGNEKHKQKVVIFANLRKYPVVRLIKMFIGLSRIKTLGGGGGGGGGGGVGRIRRANVWPPGLIYPDPAELASTISHNLHTFQRKQKRYNNIYFFNLLEVGHTESNISLK